MKPQFKNIVRLAALAVALWLPLTGRCFYNPSTGRWLSRDPVNEAGFNLSSVNPGKFRQDIEEQELGSDDSDDGAADTTTDQTNDLLYVFVQNNPEDLTDDLGLTVYLQAHHVPLGLGFNHSKVTMVVGCWSRWLGRYPMVNPMPGQPGQYYGTIGAGPMHHKLTKGLNRKWDIRLQRNVFSTTISPPGGMSEDDFIGKLLDANAQYKDDLRYVLFPTRRGKRLQLERLREWDFAPRDRFNAAQAAAHAGIQ